MTNEELFEDLKQFIEATVSQQVGDLGNRLDVVEAKMATKDDLDALRKDVEHRLGDMDEKLDEIQNAIGEHLVRAEDTLNDHEQRLTHLEHRLV